MVKRAPDDLRTLSPAMRAALIEMAQRGGLPDYITIAALRDRGLATFERRLTPRWSLTPAGRNMADQLSGEDWI